MPFRKIKELFKSKAILGAMFLALSLWAYTSLNSEYITKVQVPLHVILPESRAIENPLPSEISLEVRGSGWNLFNLIFFNTSKEVVINLSSTNINQDTFYINRSDILMGTRFLMNAEPREVIPERLQLITGSVVSNLVRIQPNIEIITKPGFMVVGDILVEPDSLVLTGNSKVVTNINRWLTKNVSFTGVNETFRATVPLSDSLSSIIDLSTGTVDVIASVQQVAEITIPDLEIQVLGGLMPTSSRFTPGTVDVIIRGGIDELIKIPLEEISVHVSYESLINDTTGIIPLNATIPKGAKLLKINPPYIYHSRILRNIKMAEL